MSKSIRIITDRLRLIRFTEHHITEKYISWLNDRELMRYSNQRFIQHTVDSCRRYLAGFENSDNLFLAIERRLDDQMIGTMTAYIDLLHSRADIGILIGDPTARRCGYGAEAWIALMQYLFDDQGIRKITAGTLIVNEAMCRLAERVGMIPDGTRTRHNLFEGSAVDVVHFAAFHGEWKCPINVKG